MNDLEKRVADLEDKILSLQNSLKQQEHKCIAYEQSLQMIVLHLCFIMNLKPLFRDGFENIISSLPPQFDLQAKKFLEDFLSQLGEE